ncbi:FAD:protein FMN transferase [uncultured Maritalea sp.]|uniref:FAD:protein FMN transferase n=1 Tax=uncultured Maritalea sp. TaxID=757249 RepID=UPI002607B9E7|nr:FAD:protein FMN transferase [uncultured Maritalea sp.]
MKQTRRSFLLGAGALLFTPYAARATSSTAVIEGPAFGASWRLVLPAGIDTFKLQHQLQAIITSVDATMSPFRPNTEISAFNNSHHSNWTPLSKGPSRVLGAALEIARETDGMFDPTIGALVGRFGFGPITRPSQGNYTNIYLENNRCKKDYADMSLDLCGIAKGYALDEMVAVLDFAGVENFLIELGGETFARGSHPTGRAWHVGIERPHSQPVAFQQLVTIDGHALATSGDSVNSYVVEGQRYSHIVNPRTTKPANDRLASVSVLATTAMRADALATALFAMGADAGPQFADKTGISALFLLRDGIDFTEITTGVFANQFLT